jgi:hypothetical protein
MSRKHRRAVLLVSVVSAVASAQSVVTLDTTARVLRAGQLNNPVAIHRRFYSQPRDEFETSQAYAARLSAMKAPQGFFAIPIDASCIGELLVYDADGAFFTVSLATVGNAFKLRCTSKLVGTYEAQNAFSAKFTVRKYERSQYAAMVGGLASVPSNLFLPMALDSARRAKPLLRIALVAEFEDPVLSTTGISHSEPTFSDPEDVDLRMNPFSVANASLWLYNSSTGVVYAKFAASDPATWDRRPSAGYVDERLLQAFVGRSVLLVTSYGTRPSVSLVTVGSVTFTVEPSGGGRYVSYDFTQVKSVVRENGTITITLKK